MDQKSTIDSINKSQNMHSPIVSEPTKGFSIAEKRRFRPIKEFLKYQKPKKFLNKYGSTSNLDNSLPL